MYIYLKGQYLIFKRIFGRKLSICHTFQFSILLHSVVLLKGTVSDSVASSATAIASNWLTVTNPGVVGRTSGFDIGDLWSVGCCPLFNRHRWSLRSKSHRSHWIFYDWRRSVIRMQIYPVC